MSSKIKFLATIILLISLFSVASAQKKSGKNSTQNKPIMWESVNIRQRNLFLGPGGLEMRPDLRKVTYVKEKKGGYSEKFYIKDGSGRTWVAKVSNEAQSETAAVRLLWGLGYKTEINYLVPVLTVPGKGTFYNARLEARPDNIKRGDNWNWGKNRFKNTDEFQGLKIMMAFINNWDLKTSNNVILKNEDSDEDHYVVSDLGVSFGKLGNNGLPIFWRIGRSRNSPADYSKGKFINGTKKDRLRIFYRGKSSGIFNDITIEQGRWLADLLLQLSDEQITDAFRAANYSKSDVNSLTKSVKRRIAELDRVTSNGFAGK